MVLATLDSVAGDVEAMFDCEIPWPEHVAHRLDEHAGMLAALKLAQSLLAPADQQRVKDAYRKARDAHYEPDQRPSAPLLPETQQQLQETVEIVRRARILDSALNHRLEAA